MLKSKEKRYEFIRFCVVGVVASGLHYGVYYLLQTKIDVNVAYTVGYLISLICNFFLTSYLTFHSSPSIRKALGFGGSHLINYLIHLSFLNFKGIGSCFSFGYCSSDKFYITSLGF